MLLLTKLIYFGVQSGRAKFQIVCKKTPAVIVFLLNYRSQVTFKFILKSFHFFEISFVTFSKHCMQTSCLFLITAFHILLICELILTRRDFIIYADYLLLFLLIRFFIRSSRSWIGSAFKVLLIRWRLP
jgi:hypothetical protein